MKKEELYREISEMVCDVTGVSYTDMIHGNREECSDARFLLVKALSVRLTDIEIAGLIGRTRQCVNSIRNNRKPMKWSVRMNWEEIRKQV